MSKKEEIKVVFEEIIRCKDCVDWLTEYERDGAHYCIMIDAFTKESDFCSFAERKEE